MPETSDPTSVGRLDVAGAVLATTGLGALIYGLIQGSGTAWTQTGVVLALATALVAGLAFVLVERRVAHPMLPLRHLPLAPVHEARTS